MEKVEEEYVEARIIESLSDLFLSLVLWKEGYTKMLQERLLVQ